MFDVGVEELLIAHAQVNDSLEQPHEHGTQNEYGAERDNGAQKADTQKDAALFLVAEHEFMNAQAAEKDTNQSGHSALVPWINETVEHQELLLGIGACDAPLQIAVGISKRILASIPVLDRYQEATPAASQAWSN